MKLASLSISMAAVLGGCFWATTKSEGEALRKDVKSLQDRLNTKEAALDDQISTLKKVLDDATKLLKRNSADLGADVDQLRNDVRTANGLVTAMNNTYNELKTAVDAYKKSNDQRMERLEERVGQIESGKPSASTSPDELWRLGTTAFQALRYNEAADIYKRLAQSYPTHDKADDALYFSGQCYTNLKDWEKAIGSYQLLNQKFPTGALTDDGLYFAAQAAIQLKQCGEARTYLSIIKAKHPKSNVAKQAATLDAQAKKDQKNKAKCSQ